MMKVLCLVVFLTVLSSALALVTVQNPLNAPDVPGFTADLQTVPAGSLIIPMDLSNQVTIPNLGLQSVLPYGVVIRTLHANISIWWAINTAKTLGGSDFVASTQVSTFGNIAQSGQGTNPAPGSSIWNAGGAATTRSYAGGPFIILSKDAQTAFNQWNDWYTAGSEGTYYKTVSNTVYDTVNIHVLTEDTTMDIRHKIYSRPVIAVSNLDGNAPTQTSILGCIYQNASGRQCPREDGYGAGDIFGSGSAGCTAFNPVDHAGLDWNYHYVTLDCGSQVAALTTTTCLTTFSEPHWQWVQSTGPSYISAMEQFVSSGANFFAQCASTQSYENEAGAAGTGTFITDYGIESINPSNGINLGGKTITNYPDLPVCQYVNMFYASVWGAVPDFYNYFGTKNDQPPSGWTIPNSPSGQPTAEGYNNFQANSFPLVTNIFDVMGSPYDGRDTMLAAGAKYNPNLQIGANIWYLSGHTWSGISESGTDSGRRYFLNALVIPANRPAACGFTFCTSTDVCPPQDACHTCACNAAGTGFVQTPIANCCLANSGCPGTCQICDTTTHQCILNPTCCATGIQNCSACLTCNQATNLCAATAGCCQSNAQCGTSPCDLCSNQACSLIPAPQCCTANSSCTGACQICDTLNNNCTRITPYASCCLANTDCSNQPGQTANPCLACNTGTNQCYTIPGCCNTAADCGTDPCIECTGNACVRKNPCCETSSQCGACMDCNSTNVCVPSTDPNCCTTDASCGTCRRCAAAGNGTKTCVDISNCCMSQADCETCQNCSNSQCIPLADCCSFDYQCPGCDICENFACSANFDLSCCLSDQDCTYAVEAAQSNPNITANLSSCGYSCQFSSNFNVQGNHSGVCVAVCSSGQDWTGLIVGLAAGVPLLAICLAGIAAALAAFLYMKRELSSGKFLNGGSIPDTGVNNNAAYSGAVTTGSSGVYN